MQYAHALLKAWADCLGMLGSGWARCIRSLLLLVNPAVSQISDFGQVEQVIATEAFRVLPLFTIFVAAIELSVVVGAPVILIVFKYRSRDRAESNAMDWLVGLI